MPLRFVDYTSPGLTRRRNGNSFDYYTARGRRVDKPSVLQRIEALAIPPAWENVWICPSAHGHLQALGRDGRGRLQYLYHAEFRKEREMAKYARLAAFARVLPSIREKVAADMGLSGLPREKVIATVVHLLETTLIRVGNDAYARQNKTFGLTTLRSRHLTVEGTRLKFLFRGKSGKDWELSHQDRRVARIVKTCQSLPGQHLFQYRGEDGRIQKVTSHHVNAYLRQVSGKRISAKDFRTWGGTVLCALALYEKLPATSESAFKKQVAAAIRSVASALGNTPAICRSCYIHPVILESYRKGDLRNRIDRALARMSDDIRLKPEEYAVLCILRSRKSV